MATYVYETIPAKATEPPRRFEVNQSMKDPVLTHDPDTGLPVRRVIQGGYLNTQRWTKSSGSPKPASTSASGSCCGVSGCGSH